MKFTSRTIRIALCGLAVLLLLAVALIVGVALGLDGSGLDAYAGAIGSIAWAVAAVAGGGAVAHGARHWGAREGSGLEGQAEPGQIGFRGNGDGDRAEG